MAGRRRLILAPAAASDLDGIYLHIYEDSPTAASGQAERILKTAHGLCDFPDIGRARPHLSPALRSVVQGSYVVFYYLHDDRIEVVRVLHSRMDIEREMLSFLTRHFRR
jgi:toxin ParE1/3/4